MDSQFFARLQDNLLAKRQALTDWLRTTPPGVRQLRLGPLSEQALHDHMRVLDGAVARSAAHELGRCDVCHDYIEPALLEMDYTACVCLSHLSADERRDLEAELELAQQVQQALFPQSAPVIPGATVAAFSRPAQIIGGDYFAFLQFRSGLPGLSIGDVAGHGVAASLLMASFQTALGTLVPASNSPARVVQELNRIFCHNIHFTTFVTSFLGSYDPATRRLTYCNAGHNPPLVRRQSPRGAVRMSRLRITGPAIGLVEEFECPAATTTLEPGDTLLLYTDGITEATNTNGEMLGEDQLAELVRPDRHASAQAVVQAVRDGLETFTQGQTQADDTTMVALHIEV